MTDQLEAGMVSAFRVQHAAREAAGDNTADDCPMSLLDDSIIARIIINEGDRPAHCNHWYDEPDTPCCRCGDNTTDEFADREDD